MEVFHRDFIHSYRSALVSFNDDDVNLVESPQKVLLIGINHNVYI